MTNQNAIPCCRIWITEDLLPILQLAQKFATINPEIESKGGHMEQVFESASEAVYAAAKAECYHITSDEFHDAWVEAETQLNVNDYKKAIQGK